MDGGPHGLRCWKWRPWARGFRARIPSHMQHNGRRRIIRHVGPSRGWRLLNGWRWTCQDQHIAVAGGGAWLVVVLGASRSKRIMPGGCGGWGWVWSCPGSVAATTGTSPIPCTHHMRSQLIPCMLRLSRIGVHACFMDCGLKLWVVACMWESSWPMHAFTRVWPTRPRQ